MKHPKAYDLIADIYDEDMGRNTNGWDIEFYIRECSAVDGRVLELGCGTGRITLSMAGSGISVVGIDNSLPMLRRLLQKAALSDSDLMRRYLAVCCMDMRHLAFDHLFSAIICPYSAFTYLVSVSDRNNVLSQIRKLLAVDGVFILDVFIPDPAMADARPILDYRRELPDGTLLERFKIISLDVTPGVNLIRRRYQFFNTSGNKLRKIVTREMIRYYSPKQIERLLVKNGFSPSQILYNASTKQGPRPDTVAFVCRKEKR